jgi:hypothetical protein
MSKLDEMRRLREQQYARQQEGGAPAPRPEVAPLTTPVVMAERAKADAEQGRCAVCGKVRALSNGLVSNHQKGFGKMCPGSRKEPI